MNKKQQAFALVFSCVVSTAIGAADKPPTLYWMSVTTGMGGGLGGMGAPAMPNMSEMIMGGLLGGSADSGQPGAGSSQRSILLQLSAPNINNDPKADHLIPPGQKMGESLPLLTPKPGKQYKSADEQQEPEKPKGRMQIYWGCGDKIRVGQPKTIDFATASMDDYRRFFRTIGVNHPRGPRPANGWTYAQWPNEQDHQAVPQGSALVGRHEIKANYAPAIHFDVPTQNDFMAPVNFTEFKGNLPDSVAFKWDAIANAVGYFAMAMGNKGADETIIWVSSETPHMGWSLMDFLPTPEVHRLIKSHVVMSPNTTTCQVPKGIFPGDGAFLQFIAYGPDLNVSHPPRPAKPPKGWQPEWVAKVRVKSTQSSILGESGQPKMGGEGAVENAPKREKAIDPVKALKGIFGF